MYILGGEIQTAARYLPGLVAVRRERLFAYQPTPIDSPSCQT